MPYVLIGLVALVAIFHVGFFLIETVLWNMTIFRHNVGMGARSILGPLADDTATWASNQGVYNLFLALGIVWGFLHPNREFGCQLLVFFSGCVLIAGLWGAYSVKNPIFLVIQALPGALLLGFVLFRGAK